MDLEDKILTALRALEPEYMRLEDDDGISGFIVTRAFAGMSSWDRQGKIDEALEAAALTREEKRRVLMIAGLTPTEYSSVGARIRVHRVKEMAGGAVDVLLHGGPPDAAYVRGALNNQKGVKTTAPKPASNMVGTFMHFRAKGTDTAPLTKDRAIHVLKGDRYIEVMPDA